jgi:hypothetical protein
MFNMLTIYCARSGLLIYIKGIFVCYHIPMTVITLLAGVFQSIFISLGVGSSTLAITNFFAAIADGTIDETERRMMGIVYIVLRVAMVGILLTTIALHAPAVLTLGLAGITTFMWAQWLVLAVLFGNATLMTARIMPSTFGPGLQAGSWYTLGIMMALALQGVTAYTIVQFALGYVAVLVLAVGSVNGVMAYLKSRKDSTSA